MPTTEDAPARAAGRIPGLIQEAMSVTRTVPGLAGLQELNLEIRAELRDLIPRVEEQIEQITERTTASYAREGALVRTKAELAQGLSPSPLAAALAIAELGRCLRTLDQFAGGDR
ncbi:DUF6415 family natural product biosynthesis protein [Streptomyces sp. NBC_00569]|uniref:DUF6415 family natural product biosynthesis protein n=1 Tax=Streptomyces sp. NBC_00569 TaxID=2975780 RepID=UPI002E817201|nr:DUF6415 family natural product biosynthesis protein [Streptomyces sp. NBC_00569]WUB92489.1 DUF6415 family natural product biosynthesis protein [Streptomyces sp. NBC_00569]